MGETGVRIIAACQAAGSGWRFGFGDEVDAAGLDVEGDAVSRCGRWRRASDGGLGGDVENNEQKGGGQTRQASEMRTMSLTPARASLRGMGR